MIHVDDDNLGKDDTVFSCLRFYRRPPAQPPLPREVTPVPLSTTPRPSNQPFHHPLPPISGPLPLRHHSSFISSKLFMGANFPPCSPHPPPSLNLPLLPCCT